jgi:hypothetical protein
MPSKESKFLFLCYNMFVTSPTNTHRELRHPWETNGDFLNAVYADVLQGEHQTHEQDPNMAWPERGITIVRYVLWQHTKNNIPAVQAYLDGSDIIALEQVSTKTSDEVSTQSRQREGRISDALINYCLGADLHPEEERLLHDIGHTNPSVPLPKDKADATIKRHFGRRNIATPIFLPHTASGRRFVSLDVDPQRAARLTLLEEKLESAEDNFRTQAKMASSYNELEEAYLLERNASADSISFREDKTTRAQLDKIIRQNPGKRIAVAYGKIHVLLSRLVTGDNEHSNVSSQRFFVPVVPTLLARVIRFQHAEAAHEAIEAAIRAGIPIPDDLLSEGVASAFVDSNYPLRRNSFLNRTRDERIIAGRQLKELWSKRLEPTSTTRLRDSRERHQRTKHILLKK